MASSRYNPEPGMRETPGQYGIPYAATCDDIKGMGVTNDQGQDLGKIEEIMLDARSGRMLYAVLSFGGFLGLGNKLFAVPWEAFGLGARNDKLILNVPKEKLERAEGFDKDHWPRHPDESFLYNTYSYYGYQPWWGRR